MFCLQYLHGKKITTLAILLSLLIISVSHAQTLPPHDALDILIVSDEVNPHGLNDNDLMQPGDLSLVLDTTITLNSNTITEVATNDIEQATTALSLAVEDAARPEILIYFAHRIPDNGNDASGRQAAFVAVVENFLQSGGGVISFHHGIYRTGGKQDMQALLGSEAIGAVPWDTANGQDVIYMGEDHFIGSHQVSYSGTTSYENPSHDIALNNYPFFNNTPD